MKIKSVCEYTGLSDRTIRYYIEEGLISPSYTENYLERKTYNFSEKDIKELNDIAILRKFDFTIEEIRRIIIDIESSKSILRDVKNRTEKTVLNCQEKLSALSQINDKKTYTIAELAEELSKLSLVIPDYNEEIKFSIVKKILLFIKAFSISAIVWLPIILSLIITIINIRNFRYPVFDPWGIIYTAIFLLPSVTILIISKIKLSFKKIIRGILLVLCVLSIPFSAFSSFITVTESETTNIHSYRLLDAHCKADRSILFQELFPAHPHYYESIEQDDGSYKTVYLDAKYHYYFLSFLNDTYDIYAEWPLNEEKYYKEISRVTKLFNKTAVSNTHIEFTEVETDNYHCLILFEGAEPFSKTEHSYSYYYTIFAYNDELKTVRYIDCSGYTPDQPYYLSLDW